MAALTSMEKVKKALLHHTWEITDESEVKAEVSDPDKVLRRNYSGKARKLGTKAVDAIYIRAFNGNPLTDVGTWSVDRLWAVFTLDGKFIKSGAGNSGRARWSLKDLLRQIENQSLIGQQERAEARQTDMEARLEREATKVAAEYQRMLDEEQKERGAVLDLIAHEVRDKLQQYDEDAQAFASYIVKRLEESGAVDGWAKSRTYRKAAGQGVFRHDMGATSRAQHGRYENGVRIDG